MAADRSPGEQFTDFIDFVQNDLPSLNTACRDQELALPSWLGEVAEAIAAMPGFIGTDVERELLIRALGIVVCSAERLAQPAGWATGSILAQLPGIEQRLLNLAGHNRVPALTHSRYWTSNLHPTQMTFTAERHEKFFISAVQTQTHLRAAVNALLRPICDGQIRPKDRECSRLLATVATGLEQARSQYRDFNHHDSSGNPAMTPEQFNEMRVWLPQTVLGGITYGGPNAAYIGEMVTTDFLFGTADAEYRQYVQGFLSIQDQNERTASVTDLNRVSVIEIIAQELGYKDATDLAAAPLEQVAAYLRKDPALQQTCIAFREAHLSFGGGAGAHYGLIVTHLIKFDESLTAAQRAGLPIQPSHGVGGHGHEHTRRLQGMRRDQPALVKLGKAVKLTMSEQAIARVGAA